MQALMDKQEMSRRQEQTLAEAIGGRRTKGSGSQWTDQMDARANHLDAEFAFAVECKSTGGQAIAVSRDMIKKAIEQAAGERPALALRIYENERYDVLYDWVAVPLADFREMVELLNNPPYIILANPADHNLTEEEVESLRKQFDDLITNGPPELRVLNFDQEETPVSAELEETRSELEETRKAYNEVLGQYANAKAEAVSTAEQLATLQQYVQAAGAESPLGLAQQLGAAQRDIAYLRQVVAVQAQQLQSGTGRHNDLQRTMAEPPPEGPDGNPVLPWTVIFKQTGPDGVPRLHGMRYDETGAMTPFTPAGEVRIENTIGQQQQIIVANQRIGHGAYYSEGRMVAQVMPLAKLAPLPDPLDQT